MLQTAFTDIIKRGNVYQFDGREKSELLFDEVSQTAADAGADSTTLTHFRSLARMFLWEEDPEKEELEREKSQVLEDSKMR